MSAPSTISNHLILTSVTGGLNIRLNSTDAMKIGCEDPLYYHEITIEFNGSTCSVVGVLLSFNYSDGGSALCLAENLSSVSSPYVMNMYGCWEGSNERCHQSFLALPFFDKTFSSFIEKGSTMTVENGRFSDEFIDVIGDVVKGLLTIHQMGYYCPAFKGQHVAVTTEYGQLRAKIWNFSTAGSELDKDGDWVRLASKIEEASQNHQIYSLEIADLCSKMKNGKLMGLKVLKHSAVLSVSKKFSRILALNNYALTYQGQSQHPYVNDPVKSRVHDDLFIFLNTISNWYQKMPQWMQSQRNLRKIKLPARETGARFLFEQRSLIEHGNCYAPPPPPQELLGPSNNSSSSSRDLEEVCRNSWEEDLLKLHNFASDLELEY